MKKTRIVKLKGENMMYLLVVLLVITLPVVNVFSKALLSETNIKVEELNYKIDVQSSTNEGLSMQINELASLENIQSIADQYGLSYINGNIKDLKGE